MSNHSSLSSLRHASPSEQKAWQGTQDDQPRIHSLTEHVPSQRLFSVSQAARYLGINDDTLRKYADLGQIPAYRFKGRRAFKLEDLNQLIDALPLWNDRSHDESRAGRERETS